MNRFFPPRRPAHLVFALLICAGPHLTTRAAEELPLHSKVSQMHWIWSQEAPSKAGTEVTFEKEFSLPAPPVSARLKFAASKGCKILINGSLSSSNADASHPTAIDLPKNFRKGDNKVEIVAPSGGSPEGVVFSLLTVDADGTRRRLESNASWKVTSASPGSAAREIKPYGEAPWGDLFASLRPSVCDPKDITLPEGFRVELLHALDEDEGSWVAMCLDPKGRMIASDAGGRLVRITPPPLGGNPADTKVETIPVEIGHANGLLWAFNSLYVTVCQEGVYGTGSGIYRVTDTDGDDVLDKVQFLRKLHGGGDHGPHALALSPDGKSITVVCGNSTRITEIQRYQVPPIWQDDLTLPKLTGHGFMKGAGAPAGYIARMSPDGQEWTLAAAGFRNQYDAAYNRVGELFTYDADMEWDLGMPWYRPTRVCHVVDGADYGWRSVSGKWPQDYADSLPPVLNVGRGSPTGVAFGYGAKFPSRFQEALFIADWTYGKIYAVHLKEEGSSYSGRLEVFSEGRGTKPTDIVVNPFDGAMYFTGGSRRSNSALYRVTYAGKESVAEAIPATDSKASALRALRHRLEAGYHETDPASMALALENLGHTDRFIRFAARTLLEFRASEAWDKLALAKPEPRALVQTALALARLQKQEHKTTLFDRLAKVDLAKLDPETRLDLIRAMQVVSIRLGDPEVGLREALLTRLHQAIPSTESRLNVEAAQLLVRWKSPLAASKVYGLFQKAPTQEEQISYAACLRLVQEGWPEGAREKFFRWFLREEFHKAGHLAKFVTDIRKDAIASLSDGEKARLETVLNAPPETRPAPPVASRLFVKNWDTAELASLVEPLLKTPRNHEKGKALYRETGCSICHLFRGEGGAVGPDLTLVGNRFSIREIIESITEPSKVISDQYGTTNVTLKTGEVFSGRLVNEGPDLIQIQENLFTASDVRDFSRKQILKLEPSPISLMPPGLINTCQPEDVADLISWLLAGDK